MLEKLIKDLQETEKNELIKINATLPSSIMEVYNNVIELFVDYYHNSVLEYQQYIKNLDAKNNGGINSYVFKASEPADHSQIFYREAALDEKYIFSLGGKSTLRENLTEIVQKYIMLAGGCISDYIISSTHNKEYNPKDIDIFINRGLLRGIRNEEDYNPNNHISNSDFINKILSLSNFAVDETIEVDADTYGLPPGSITSVKIRDYDVELVVCENDKFFRFDINIRNFFANNNGVYTYTSVLNDIKEKNIGLMTMHTPYSSLFRLFKIASKTEFTIDDKSLFLISVALHGSTYREFKKNARKSSHYSYNLEREIMTRLNITFKKDVYKSLYSKNLFGDNVRMMFAIDDFSYYNSSKKFHSYAKLVGNLEKEDLFHLTPLVKKSLDTYHKFEPFIFKRTKSLDMIKGMRLFDEMTFEDWYNKNYLSSFFLQQNDIYSNEEPLLPEDYEGFKKLLYNNDYSFLFSDRAESVSRYVPGILMPELEFDLEINFSSIRKGFISLSTNYLKNYSAVNLVLDIENKTIQPFYSSGNFLGFFEEHYNDFIEQFMKHYKLEEYTYLKELAVYTLPDTMNSTDFLKHLIPLESIEGQVI